MSLEPTAVPTVPLFPTETPPGAEGLFNANSFGVAGPPLASPTISGLLNRIQGPRAPEQACDPDIARLIDDLRTATDFMQSMPVNATQSAMPLPYQCYSSHLDSLCHQPLAGLLMASLFALEGEPLTLERQQVQVAIQAYILHRVAVSRPSDKANPFYAGDMESATTAASSRNSFDLRDFSPLFATSPVNCARMETPAAPSRDRRSMCDLDEDWRNRAASYHALKDEVNSDDWDRTVYVSWIPRVARAHSVAEKTEKQYALRARLRTNLGVENLSKVLLFPPRGNHAKLIFDTRVSAEQFLEMYGGTAGSDKTNTFKNSLCASFGLGPSSAPLLRESLDAASIKIEWCFTREYISELKSAKP